VSPGPGGTTDHRTLKFVVVVFLVCFPFVWQATVFRNLVRVSEGNFTYNFMGGGGGGLLSSGGPRMIIYATGNDIFYLIFWF
jgi:hypothetical protein